MEVENDTISDPWKEVLDKVEESDQDSRNKNFPDCPRVGVLISSNGTRVATGFHDHPENFAHCRHGEVKALEEFIPKLSDNNKSITPADCILYTSLEPCNHRNRFQVPCAHRIATLSFKEISIGMLDPNPAVYGRGVAYLIENMGRNSVNYAPKERRKQFIAKNQSFIKKEEAKFNISHFKDLLPIFTGYDEETYLGLSHSLFRMYNGSKIVWLFPELPTFLDIHKFHAVWAQGMLENPHLTNGVEIIIHNDTWDEYMTKAEKAGMIKILETEFGNTIQGQPEVKVYRTNCSDDCPCKKFKGALLYGGDDSPDKIDCLVIPMYTKIECTQGVIPLSMFLVCEPKYLAYIAEGSANRERIQAISSSFNEIYKAFSTHKNEFKDISELIHSHSPEKSLQYA